MADKKTKEIAEYILASIGSVNPYNRSGQNLKSEYYIYEMGFLAGVLASIYKNDPILFREFREHIKNQKKY